MDRRNTDTLPLVLVPSQEDSWLGSPNLDAQGNMLVEFDDNALGAHSVGPVIVGVPTGQITSLFSDLGVLARTASTSPGPWFQFGLP
jgi:hypothetical protein